MAVQLIPLGIAGATRAAPFVANLVRQYGPKVLGAMTGASLGDKFIDVGQLEKEKDIGKLPASEVMDSKEESKIPPFMGVIPTVIDLIEGFSRTDPKPKEKGLEQEDVPDMSIMTMAKPKFNEEGKRVYKINRKEYTEDELNFEGDGRSYADITSVKGESKSYLAKEDFEKKFQNFLNDNPDFLSQYYEKRLPTGLMKKYAPIINEYLGTDLSADSITRRIGQIFGKKELTGEKDKFPTEMTKTFGGGYGDIGFDIGRSADRKEFKKIEDALEFFESQRINPRLQTQKGGILEGPQKAINFLNEARDGLNIIVNQPEIKKEISQQLGENFIPFKFDKSHADRTLSPSDEASQFGGTDVYDVKILESQVNFNLQPDLEKALSRHIKNKNVAGAKNIIEMMTEYSIGTRMNTPVKDQQLTIEDKKWAEKNNLITVPMIEEKGEASNIKDYDNVIFGTLEQPSPQKIIEDGIKVRLDYIPAKKRHEELKSKKPFHQMLKDGGMVGISHLTRPL